MAFIFPLATLLRLREINVEREERLLGDIQGQIRLTAQTLLDLAASRNQEISRRENVLGGTTSAAELLLSFERERSLETLQRAAQEQLNKLETLRLQQMSVYQSAYQNKEVLTSLREDQREVFLQARARREQEQMDDNFSSRQSRR